jgi:branched-chain amino acid transport system substrate-binding protein
MANITRRRFLKSIGGAASGFALGGVGLKRSVFAANNKPIRWGFLDVISGTFGVFGKGNIGGTKLAIKKINDAGGILGRRVELVIEDTEANTEIAARKARKLILQDRVDVIQGSASTSTSTVIMQMCARYKMLHLNAEFDSHSTLPAKSDYSFTVAQLCNENERARILALKMKYKPSEIKRWYVFYPDYSFGHDMRNIYKDEVKKWIPGAEIVGMGTHPLGEPDFTTHIAKILETKPQVFIGLQWAGDELNFINQAIPYGFFEKVPIVTISTANLSAIVALKGKCPDLWVVTDKGNPYFDHMEEWRNEYKEYLGEWPVTESASAYYDAVYMYKEAAEKAGTTDDLAVAKALETLDYSGPSGGRNIQKNHIADIGYCVLTRFTARDKFEWKVPGETIKVPYEKTKLSDDELIKMGCKWCKGK